MGHKEGMSFELYLFYFLREGQGCGGLLRDPKEREMVGRVRCSLQCRAASECLQIPG